MSPIPSLTAPVLMFAADHRWQWEEWFEQHGVDRRRLSEVKGLAADGFLHARTQSADVRRSGALLMDTAYGRAALDRVAAAGATVGMPAERAGAFPLEWAAEPFDQHLSGAFVKVLVRERLDQPRPIRDGQLAKLLTLQSWCRQAGKSFVLEVLVPREGEAEDAFERHGRPRALADFVTDAYAAGVVPDYWKIEGVPDAAAIAPIDRAIAARPDVRQLVLGKNADLPTVGRWFAAAAEASTAGGFAIGRTVYWAPAIAYLEDRATRDQAVAEIAGNYLRVVDLWKYPHQQAGVAP